MPLQNFQFNETSPAAAGTVASSQVVTGSLAVNVPAGVAGWVDDYESIDIAIDLQGATGGSLDVYVQISPNNGAHWYDIIHFPQVLAGAALVHYQVPLSQATNTLTATQVGKDLSPALVSGAVVNGAFGDRFRLVMVAGAGTSAGAPVTCSIQAQRSRLREAGGS